MRYYLSFILLTFVKNFAQLHYCNYKNNNGVITWKSDKPMVFFYGHELKKNDEISVL